jgi:HAD superfamily hydrolase (TIGR01509 family)
MATTDDKNTLFPLHQIRHILMDIDGTLVSSNDAHAHAFIDAFEAHGINTITFNHIRKLMGMGGEQILRLVLDEATFQEKGEAINADRIRIFQERYMEQVPLIPGTLPLLDLLQTEGFTIGLSSNSPPEIVDYFIRKLEIEKLIVGSTTCMDVPEGKPNPAAIEAACEKFKFDPNKTILIGDSPYDVIAAQEFSMCTLGVLTGGYTREELEKTGAIAVYENLNHIYRQYADSVLSAKP